MIFAIQGLHTNPVVDGDDCHKEVEKTSKVGTDVGFGGDGDGPNVDEDDEAGHAQNWRHDKGRYQELQLFQ